MHFLSKSLTTIFCEIQQIRRMGRRRILNDESKAFQCGITHKRVVELETTVSHGHGKVDTSVKRIVSIRESRLNRFTIEVSVSS